MKAEMFLQCEFSKWLTVKKILFNASPSGVKLPMITAVNLKRAGSHSGYPDIIILHARAEYHGLFIELKAGDNPRVTPEQRVWQEALTKEGYKAVIMPKTKDFSAALNWLRDLVENYLAGKPND